MTKDDATQPPEPAPTSAAQRSRAAEARSLVVEAQVSGLVHLARLTDAEELLLGGGLWALSDVDVVTRWAALSPSRQDAVLVGARRSLLARDLATVEESMAGKQSEPLDADLLVPSAALGLVMAARANATFVGLTGGPETHPIPGPRLYALVDDEGLQGLVVEVAAGGEHDYRLASPELAARRLTAWALRHLQAPKPEDRPPMLVVELLRHREGETMTMAGALVTAPRGLLTLATRDFEGARERTVAVGAEDVEHALLTLLLEAAVQTGQPADE
ncbi:MAG: hypothetical protein M3Y06_12260 [Actinomycetota bacterium]|nr:hypothetical protein [Actinomycetota bacterium]